MDMVMLMLTRQQGYFLRRHKEWWKLVSFLFVLFEIAYFVQVRNRGRLLAADWGKFA